MNFSAVERAKDVKFCKHVGLLSGQVFFHFGGPRSKVKVTRDKHALSAARPTQLRYEWYAPLLLHAGRRAHLLVGDW